MVLSLNNFLILPRRHRDTEENIFSLLGVSVTPWQNYNSLDNIEMGKLINNNCHVSKNTCPRLLLIAQFSVSIYDPLVMATEAKPAVTYHYCQSIKTNRRISLRAPIKFHGANYGSFNYAVNRFNRHRYHHQP